MKANNLESKSVIEKINILLVIMLICMSPVSAIYYPGIENNSTTVQNNIDVSFYGFSVVNTTRHTIEFGEPVEWTTYVTDGVKTFTINYETPAIYSKQINSVYGDVWVSNMTFTTNYSGIYYNISLDVGIPVPSNTNVISDVDYSVDGDNNFTFILPELNKTQTIVFRSSYNASMRTNKTAVHETDLGFFKLETGKGIIERFVADEELNLDFKIYNLTNHSNLTVNISLPIQLPEGIHFYLWKELNGKQIQVPYAISESRDIIYLHLQDGVIDDDGIANGIIEDPLQIKLPDYNVNIIKINSTAKVIVDNNNIYMKTFNGNFDSVTIVDPNNLPNLPVSPTNFKEKLLKFRVTNFTGNSTNIYLNYNKSLKNIKLWKFNSNNLEWYNFPYELVNDTTIKLTLVDGGFGDDDGIVNGIIEDDLGITNNWWNESWGWRTGFNISNTAGNLTDYQVEIKLTNSNFNFSQVNANLSDLRFTYYNGSADSELECAYWISNEENLSQNYTTGNYDVAVWINAPFIENNTITQYFIYYGNVNAESKSNGTTTFLFFDDFANGLSKWDSRDTDINIQSGFGNPSPCLNISGGTTSSPYGFAVLGSNTTYTGFTAGIIDADMYLSTGSIAEIAYRGLPGTNNGQKSRWDARSGQGISFLSNPYSGWEVIQGPSGSAVSTGSWVNINVTVTSNTQAIMADGNQSLETNAFTDFSAGEIALMNHYGDYSIFDNIRVRKYADPEPTTTLIGQEYVATFNITIDQPTQNAEKYKSTSFTMNGTVNCTRGSCGNISAYYQYYATNTPLQTWEETTTTDFNSYNESINISLSGGNLKLESVVGGISWWNNQWRYRQELNISNTAGNLSDHQVKLILNSSNIGGNFNWAIDENSLRFIWHNSSSGDNTEISHWVKEWNSTSSNAVIWVKIPFLENDTNTMIHVYYGNANVNSTSSSDNTFYFYSNGSSLSGWTNNGVSVDPGEGDPVPSLEAIGGTYAYRDIDLVPNRIIELGAYVIPGATDLSNIYFLTSSAGSGQMFRFETRSGTSPGFASTTSWASWNAPSGYSPISSGVWHNVTIILNSTTARGYIDSNYYGSYTFSNNGGYIAVHGDGGVVTGGNFDNIIVRGYASTEPSLVANGSEQELNLSANGYYISSAFDTGTSDNAYQNISWNSETNANTSIKISTRTSVDSIDWSSWFTENNNSEIQSPNNRYIQYKIAFNTSNTKQTPVLDDISLLYRVAMNDWADMESTNTFFTTTNPYNCGILNQGQKTCSATRQVTPTKSGNYSLRFLVNSTASELQKNSEVRNVSVFMQPSFSTFTKSKNPVAREDDVDLTALLLDGVSSPLEEYNISFYDETHNGTRYYIGSALTNSNGYATISYTLSNDSNLGTHTLNATYSGSSKGFIKGAEISTTLSVSSKPQITDINISPEKIGFGYNITITANITDEVGLDKIQIIIINESSDAQTYDMTHISGDIYQYFFNDSWRVQDYDFQIFANNSDGINTTSTTDTFAVEVYVAIIMETNKSNYKNNEKVYLDNSSNSFYQGWQYRTPIEINSTLNISDYAFKVVLDSTNFDFTKPQSNGADIRFSYYNFTSSSEQTIPYWIETWDSSVEEAIIWTKVPLITTSSNKIYVYYGNTIVSSDEDPDSLFDFFDDFDGTTYNDSIWQSTSPANMHVSGGRIRINNGCLYTNNTVAQSDDIIFESKLRWYSGTGTAYAGMMAVDVQDMQGSNSGADANVLYMTQSDGSGDIRYWMGDGTVASYNLGSGYFFSRTNNTDYVLGIGFNGTNNMLFRNYGLEVTRGTFNESVYFYLGYFTGSNAGSANIQDINVSWARVRKFINLDDEPTSSFGTEEILEKGLRNTGTTDIKGYLRMLTQRWTGSTWQNIVPPVIEDGFHTISAHSYLNLASEWASAGAWNTTNRDPGIYRVYAVFEDANHNTLVSTAGTLLKGVYNFTIVESVMKLINLTHENEYEYSLLEYETLDNIAWINATVQATNNIAYDANITMGLLDQSLDPVGWGPINETKDCGDIAENQYCEKKWDNSSNGYIIPSDTSSGTYNFFWDVMANSDNGQEQTNSSLSFKVYSLPSTVTHSLKDIRIEKPNSTTYNFTFTNLWTKNLTNLVVEINCPDFDGFNCSSFGSGTEIENIGNLMNGTSVTVNYTISANESVSSDNYNISVNVNYTNPGQENKSWQELGVEVLEVRLIGILQITDYSHPTEITRNYDYFDLKAYMNNSADDVANNTWINYTLPSGWTNSSSGLNKYYVNMTPSEIKWNNLTVHAGITSSLGPVNVRLDSGALDGRADFKIYSITTYANTTLGLLKNNYVVNRGENSTITAMLKYDNGSVLSGKNISFYDQTAGVFLGSGLTNSTGQVEINYYINSTSSLGIHTINASYNGTSALYLRGAKNTTDIDVHELPQITNVIISPNITGYGQNVLMNATISDADNIDDAWINITYPNSPSSLFDMNFVPPNFYYYKFNDTWQKGLYNVTITANDTTGAIQTSAQYNFTVSASLLLTMQTVNNSYGQNAYVNLSAPNSSSSDKWWNNSWEFSKPINITNIGKNMAHYQLMVVVETGTLYADSKIQSDCDDIRFVSYNQSSSGFNQLNYWIDGSCNISIGGNTTYWVNIPVLETPSTIVDMYYGNTGVGNAESTPEEIFDFFDDFDGTTYNDSIWQSTSPANMHVSGGRIRINNGCLYTNNTVAQSDDIIFESKLRWYSGTGTAYAGMMAVDVQDMQGSNSGADANVLYMTQSGGGSLLYYYMGDGTTTGYNLGSGSTGFNRVSDTDYVLGIGFNGTRNLLFRDYNHVLDRGTFNESVYFYLGAFTGSGASNTDIQDMNVSWARARKFLYPEPTYLYDSENVKGSKIFNNGATDNSGYFLMKIQKNNSGVWQDVDVIINDSNSGIRRSINVSGLAVDPIWNAISWFTATNNAGDYRAYAELQDPDGNILSSDDGLDIEGCWKFNITEPKLNLNITNINIYEVTGASEENWHIYTNDFIDSGLNKSFTLDVGHIYRIEVDVENIGSSNWSINTTNITYYAMNDLWNINTTNHIWYSNKSTISLRRTDSSKQDGSFNGTLIWNNSLNGNVESSDTATFFFIVNTSTSENRQINFNIKHATFERNDYSAFNVIVSDSDPPVIINNNYNLTTTSILRGETMGIYGQWDETITEANATYNTVAVGTYVTITNSSPQNSGNWTNFTMQSYSTWYLGNHSAKLIAKDQSENINNTLQYLNYTVWGLARVSNIELNKTPINVSETVKVSCKVIDNTDSDSPIQNYNVTFYNSSGLIGTVLTNSSGWASFDYIDNTPGSEYLNCTIAQDNTSYYQIDSQNKKNILLSTLETVAPYNTTVNGPTIAHKGETVSLDVYWNDDSQLDYANLATNSSGSWNNVSGVDISGTGEWANISYQIPTTFGPATLGWKQYANDTSGNINVTPEQQITVWGYSEISSSVLDPESIQSTNYTNMACTIIDSNDSTTLQNYNVSFWYKNSTESSFNYLGSNLTNSSGISDFNFNLSVVDTYIIKCNITDDPSLLYNDTSDNYEEKTLNVVSGVDVNPPQIIGNNYTVNVTSVYREGCFYVSGLWDESINFSYVQYNKSESDITQVNIPEPYTGNWTNISICTNSTWETGDYSVKLFAKDQSGNTNNDLEYKFVLVKARAKVYWDSPTGNLNRSTYNLSCQVKDYGTTDPIEGYTVTFYDGDLGYSIGSNTTNSTGYAMISHNYSSHPVGPDTLSCVISPAGGYEVVDSGTIEETVYFYGQLNVSLDDPVTSQVLHRGDSETLLATVVDENAQEVTPTVKWYDSTSSEIASGKSTSWNVPSPFTLGSENISVNVSGNYYYSDSDSVIVDIWGYSELDLITPLSGAYYPDDAKINISCHVTDEDSLGNIANYPVRFYDDVTPLGHNNTAANGIASRLINTSSLSEGSNTLKCVIYDNETLMYNTSSPYQESVTITVDKTNPQISYNSNTDSNGTYDKEWIFVNISISETNLDEVLLYWNGVSESFASNDGTNYWSNKTTLGDNSYEFYAYINDSAGNNNQTLPRNITLDTTDTIINIINPGDKPYNSSSVNFDYTASDINRDSCWYILDSDPVQALAGCINTSLSGLGEGVHNITLYVNDTANNTASTTRNFSVDLTKPVINITAPSNGTRYVQSSVDLNYTVSDDINISNCWYTLNGGSDIPLSNCANTTLSGLANDNHTVNVYANDTAGNINYSIVEFEIDYNELVATPIYPVNNSLIASQITYVNVTTNIVATACNYTLDAGSAIVMTNNSALDWNATVTSLSESQHNVSFSCTNVQNTSVTSHIYFTVDLSGPIITFEAPTPNDGGAVGYDWVYVNISLNEAGDESVLEWHNSSGSYNFTMSEITNTSFWYNITNLDDTNYSYKIYANDTVSNSANSSLRTVTVSSIAPAIMISSPVDLTDYTDSVVDLNVTATTVIYSWIFNLNGINYSFNPNISIALAQGDNNLTVYGTDNLGRTGSSSIDFTFNNTVWHDTFRSYSGLIDINGTDTEPNASIGFCWPELFYDSTIDEEAKDCWQYRKEINLTTSASLTDYQVLLNVNLSLEVSSGKAESDCSDLRFGYFNKTSSSAQEIDYWIEECNNINEALVWVNVPEINTNATVYVYYGNDQATDESNGGGVFVVFDDFTNVTSAEWGSNAANWNVSSGIAIPDQSGDSSKLESSTTTPDSFASELKIKSWSDLGSAGYYGIGDSVGSNYVRLYFDPLNNRVNLYNGGNNHYTINASEYQRYTITSDFDNDNYSLLINRSVSAINLSSAAAGGNKKPVFYSYKVSGIYLDFVGVRKYNPNEPTAGNFGSEETPNINSTMQSILITKTSDEVWGNFTVAANFPSETGAAFRIFNSSNSSLCGDLTYGDVSSGYDICVAADSYDSLYLYGKLTTDTSLKTPTVSDWSIDWAEAAGGVDLKVLEINFSSVNLIEGENVTVSVNVTNNDTQDSGQFVLQLNASLWNGSKIWNETLNSSAFNLTASESKIVNFSWIAKIGTYIFDAYIDIDNDMAETNETNNLLNVNITTSAWEIFYGDYKYNYVLINSNNDTLANWTPSEVGGNVYYSDYDASYFASDLKPLNGSNDLIEVDSVFGISGFNDSVKNLFDPNDDGSADFTRSIVIAGTLVENIPIVNSTNSSAFITGLLWDSADGGSNYNGTQDLVIISVINASKAGKYGIYDYEVKVPSMLGDLTGGTSLVDHYGELI